MQKLLSILAFIFSCISLIIHLISYFNINIVDKIPFIYILPIILIVFLLLMFFSLIKSKTESFSIYKVFFKSMPKWVPKIVIILGIYYLINFFLSLSWKGLPTKTENNKYKIINNDRVVRELTEEEYNTLKAKELRIDSSCWLLFFILPAFHFWYRQHSDSTDKLK